MKKTDLCKVLLGWGMATLLLAGCGSDGGGGGGSAVAKIDSPTEAKAAAGSAAVVFSGGLSSLVGSAPGAPAPRLSRAQRFAANFKAQKMPQADAVSQAIAAMRAQAAAIGKAAAFAPVTTACSVSGNMTVDSTLDSVTGSSSEETTFANCNNGFGVMNGREKFSTTINAAGTSITFTNVFGDGDEILEATDLVFTAPDGSTMTQTGTETDTVTLTSGTASTYQNNGNAAYSEISSMKSKFNIKSPSLDLTLTASLTFSDTATQTGDGSSYTVNGTSQIDGSMTLAGTGGGQTVQFSFNADNASETYTENYNAATLTFTSTSAPSGTLSITLLPASCFDGTFKIVTVTPIKTVESGTTVTTVEGEIIVNDNTHFIYNNNNITITFNGTTVFSGTEDALYAELDDSCPLFAML